MLFLRFIPLSVVCLQVSVLVKQDFESQVISLARQAKQQYAEGISSKIAAEEAARPAAAPAAAPSTPTMPAKTAKLDTPTSSVDMDSKAGKEEEPVSSGQNQTTEPMQTEEKEDEEVPKTAPGKLSE